MEAAKLKYPLKVRAGYTLLRIGSILLFLFATAMAAFLVLALVVGTEQALLREPETIVSIVLDFIVVLFYIGAGIAGLNYAAHRKFLVWVVAFAAFFFLFIFLYRTIEIVVRFVEGRGSPDDIVEIILTFFTQTIYFVGWHLSKDYFED